MKALVLARNGPVENNPLKFETVDDPVPGQGEIRLKVHVCAVCRTDLHIIEGELKTHQFPLVPGHQIVGIVDQVGPGSRRFRIGDRVGVAWLRHTCGQCAFCRSDRENLCEKCLFTGYHAHGGFAEFATVDENYAYQIPAIFSDAEAAPLLCAGIIGYRALKRSQLPAKGTLGIFGFGSSAHVIIQIAKHRGHQICVVSRSENHRKLAEDLGADWVGDSTGTLPAMLDSVIIFAPVGTVVPSALSVTKRGGTVVLAGIYLSDIPPLNYEKHLFYERNLCSVTANTRVDGIECLSQAAEIPIRPKVTVFPLEEGNRALQDLKADKISGTGVLVIKG
ncbi:MAG: zinc-dependent alcohol dehydrogenase family protein [Deltaproteobacteria bacterium]|nr:zinc-dependent alcohol dehydrogenase family protein [Deltaproteobacteria bacterium]